MDFIFRQDGKPVGISSLIFICLCASQAFSANVTSPWPLLGNGLQEVVQWDHYSIIINGERLLLLGGEIHPFRLPVPELWWDTLQKIKAMGLRMVSIYTHWGFHSPTPDTVDFAAGAHNISRFLEMARDVGLYVLIRPGPYINGELNAGGMPLWVTTGSHGTPRSNDSAFTDAWTPYLDGIGRLTRPYQITEQGTVIMYQIENEYGYQWRDERNKVPNLEAVSYMEKLQESARRNGIVVPLVHNGPNINTGVWSRGYDTVGAGGNVDIYGVDSYPQCWSCILEECGNITPWAVSDYHSHFQHISPRQPSFMPEFQAGAMNPWAGPAGGCKERTGVDFVNFYYRDALAQRVTILNLYMISGGTNWGWLSAPFIGSSYDYGAAISEDRSIGDKFYEIKNLALFARVAHDLAAADVVGAGTEYTNNPAVFVTELRNPVTGAGFYVLRHAKTASDSEERFRIRLKTSVAEIPVPRLSVAAATLSGREGEILVTDFRFGRNHILYYSLAEVLTYTVLDGGETTVLVLWTPAGRIGEFYLAGAGSAIFVGSKQVTIAPGDDGILVGYVQTEGMIPVKFDNGVTVLLIDRKKAYEVWVPVLTSDPRVPEDQTAIIITPSLVRSASLSSTTLSLTGDTNTTAPDDRSIEIFTSSRVTEVLWNNRPLNSIFTTPWSSIRGLIPPPSGHLALPTPSISGWKSRDALPERHPDYSPTSAAWVLANDTSSSNPAVDRTTTTTPYLFADQYGFHTGVKLWRGVFRRPVTNSTPSSTGDMPAAPTGAYLRIQGGTAHAWAVYLNGEFIGSWVGDSSVSVSEKELPFPARLLGNEENVLLVVQEDTGHDQLAAAVNPRGILNVTLLASPTNDAGAGWQFSEWKIAGTAGDGRKSGQPYGRPLDTVRTRYNEGGLAPERRGWHLPGYDLSSDEDSTSSWTESSPEDDFTGAGVRFYRGILHLDVPRGLDVSLAFRIKGLNGNGTVFGEEPGGFRVLLFVNGWQYGRYYPDIASEDTFPVPPGVLDYGSGGGENVIGLIVWALQEGGASVKVDVVVRYTLDSSLDVNFDGRYLRLEWSRERLQYV